MPVARDANGGLVVSDLPSLAAPPARASVSSAPSESVPASERDAIEDVVSRFMELYLAGDAGGLVVADAGRVCGSARSISGTSSSMWCRWRSLARRRGSVREVLATVRAKDAAGATLALRYRLRLVREDRWLVAAVNTTEKAG